MSRNLLAPSRWDFLRAAVAAVAAGAAPVARGQQPAAKTRVRATSGDRIEPDWGERLTVTVRNCGNWGQSPILFGSIIAAGVSVAKQGAVRGCVANGEGRGGRDDERAEGRLGAATNAVAIVSAETAREA
jgi:hypothetical protein